MLKSITLFCDIKNEDVMITITDVKELKDVTISTDPQSPTIFTNARFNEHGVFDNVSDIEYTKSFFSTCVVEAKDDVEALKIAQSLKESLQIHLLKYLTDMMDLYVDALRSLGVNVSKIVDLSGEKNE